MTISAEVIADSISPQGVRLTTLQLRYPRFIHAEFMTHRVFSRNASSSRAIPVERMIEDLRRDPAMPVFWGSNKPGMQAGEELTGVDLGVAHSEWETARDACIEAAEMMIKYGLHKQIANRILEPWAHISVIVTATEWENFFNLRCHKDAQPEIRVLAECMRDAMYEHTPLALEHDEWHLPYVSDDEATMLGHDLAIKLSVARCARVSYLTHEGKKPDIESDLKLYERLVGSHPIHASPAEHQATPDIWWPENPLFGRGHYNNAKLHGNFNGWIQYRRTLEGGIA